MEDERLDLHKNKAANLRAFRCFLHLSQGEFIQRYFTQDGQRMISVSKLSMAENGTLSDIDSLIERVSTLAFLPQEQFALPSEEFSKNLFRFTPENISSARGSKSMEHAPGSFESAVKGISDYLAKKILTGELKPGSQLPPERELATEFNIKRPVLRDVFKVLMVLGLLDIRPGDGTYISAIPTDFYALPLSWNLMLGAKYASEVIELRFLLDEAAAVHMMNHATAEDIEQVRQVLEELQEAYDSHDIQRYLDLDIEFHLAIARASRKELLYTLLITMHQLMRSNSAGALVYQYDIALSHQNHQRIFQAILNGDREELQEVFALHKKEALDRFMRNQDAGFQPKHDCLPPE